VDKKYIAGMSIKGGRRDNFYLCLLEHYAETGRYFLRSLLQVKDDEDEEKKDSLAHDTPRNIKDGDDIIRSWIEKYQLTDLVVDFPLTVPACETCALNCPGASRCPEVSVVDIRKKISWILEQDATKHNQRPKQYERERNKDDEVFYSKDVLAKISHEHLISRSFRRRLKKGYLPYWNRPIDFWVWMFYYDQLLSLFKISYDSFGTTSLIMLFRFSYLQRHFPHHLQFFEGNTYITLLELLRSKTILKKDILLLGDIELGPESRLNIIKAIEGRLGLFVYDHDLEILVKNPRAFDSFLLALVGQTIHKNKIKEIPLWANPIETNFVIPDFS